MPPLSLFNWSLKETLSRTTDSVLRAKIIVFYFVFLANFLKVGILLPSYLVNNQPDGWVRCIIAVIITTIVLKILLSRPQYLSKLIHFSLFSATCFGWANLFIDHQNLNLVIIQDVFMICMWSFYGLSGRWGLVYSIIAAIPVIARIVMNQSSDLNLMMTQTSLESTVLIIILNFIIIFLGHYYYRNILYASIEAKEKLNRELEKSNAAKTLFFSSVSHELRNPLNTVIGMANLLKGGNKDQVQNENLDILKFSAESLLSLINNILDFNKMGSGKVELESIPFNLKRLLENACAGLKIEATEKGLYFKITVAQEFGDRNLLGDPTRLMQIIYNLVGNAIKFTDKGGIEIGVNIVERKDADFRLRFIIQDTGLGISAENQRHIFDPFTQASVTTTRQFGGTGLGLGIVKHLLTLHQSTIHLESEVNAGTKFYFDINYTEASGGVERLNHYVQQTDVFHPSGMRVLMAEDNAMNVLFMKKLFERWKIELTVAENGGEVVRLMEEHNYDLILMDIHMPVLNGYEAAKIIRVMKDREKANVYIIALTGSVSDEVISLVRKSGMNDILHKPFQPENLYQKMENIRLGDSLKST
jgi:signal transduction histidine kinase/CheY-like chemotaxis protein